MLAGERLQGKTYWENIIIFVNQKKENFKQGQNLNFVIKAFPQNNKNILFPLMALIPKYKTVPQQYLNPSSAIRKVETKGKTVFIDFHGSS